MKNINIPTKYLFKTMGLLFILFGVLFLGRVAMELSFKNRDLLSLSEEQIYGKDGECNIHLARVTCLTEFPISGGLLFVLGGLFIFFVPFDRFNMKGR